MSLQELSKKGMLTQLLNQLIYNLPFLLYMTCLISPWENVHADVSTPFFG